jgi:eukaryotic-like serine/threonine-protein kinase
MEAYLCLNQYPEALAVGEQAAAAKSDSANFHIYAFLIGFINGDRAMMERQIAWGNTRGANDRAFFLTFQSGAAASQGRLKQARQLSTQAVELLESHNIRELAAADRAGEAEIDTLYGNISEGRRGASEALGIYPGVGARSSAAWVFAATGDSPQSEKLLDALARESPDDTLQNALILPDVRSEIELNLGRPERVLDLLRPAIPYEFSRTTLGLVAIYTRGRAYLKMKQGNAAASEFQKILDHQGLAAGSPFYPLARLGLARAYSLTGDKDKSRAAYQDFLALWKDADPDIPVLKEAKAEYAKLQ